MSLQDIHSVRNMMLLEMRDTEKLEKELNEFNESKITQQQQFELEMDKYCRLDKKRVDVERGFIDLTTASDVERMRASQVAADLSRIFSVLSLNERVINNKMTKTEVILEISQLSEAIICVDEKLSSFSKGEYQNCTQATVARAEEILQEKTIFFSQQKAKSISITDELDRYVEALNLLKVRKREEEVKIFELHQELLSLDANIASTSSLRSAKISSFDSYDQKFSIELKKLQDELNILSNNLTITITQNSDDCCKCDVLRKQCEEYSVIECSIKDKAQEIDNEIVLARKSIAQRKEREKKVSAEIIDCKSEVVALNKQIESLKLLSQVYFLYPLRMFPLKSHNHHF